MAELTQVHDAGPEDEDAIFDLLTLLHEENAVFAMSETKVRAFIRQCIRRDRAIAGVVRVDGKAIGTVGMVVENPWWTDDPCLVEKFNIVHPDHRRSNYAVSLIAYAKTCCDKLSSLGIPLLIGVFSNERTEAKLRFYKRQLTPAGAFFSHNMDLVRHGQQKALEHVR